MSIETHAVTIVNRLQWLSKMKKISNNTQRYIDENPTDTAGSVLMDGEADSNNRRSHRLARSVAILVVLFDKVIKLQFTMLDVPVGASGVNVEIVGAFRLMVIGARGG